MHNKTTALITGASEGFGRALAIECARRGLNLVLVALPGSGLSKVARFIKTNMEVDVHFFEIDLTKKEECLELYAAVKKRNIPISILINNAGIGGTFFFKERDIDYYYRQIELNVLAPTLLTRLFLEILEEQSPSHILNVSSLAGFFCLPRKVVYGGTKSYLVSFSKSLRHELKTKNVFVSTVCPGGMNTTLALILQHKNLKGLRRWSILNPEVVAEAAIDGMLKNKELIIPGLCNKIFMLMDKVLPEWFKKWLAGKNMLGSQPDNQSSWITIDSFRKAI